eukprot:m.21233 g.21233  ORF g.21233 m.21233 type:complete len:146 (-) comp6362_c0_seq1:197-634(-)
MATAHRRSPRLLLSLGTVCLGVVLVIVWLACEELSPSSADQHEAEREALLLSHGTATLDGGSGSVCHHKDTIFVLGVVLIFAFCCLPCFALGDAHQFYDWFPMMKEPMQKSLRRKRAIVEEQRQMILQSGGGAGGGGNDDDSALA